jgi:hypothetical protein
MIVALKRGHAIVDIVRIRRSVIAVSTSTTHSDVEVAPLFLLIGTIVQCATNIHGSAATSSCK